MGGCGLMHVDRQTGEWDSSPQPHHIDGQLSSSASEALVAPRLPRPRCRRKPSNDAASSTSRLDGALFAAGAGGHVHERRLGVRGGHAHARLPKRPPFEHCQNLHANRATQGRSG
jgi:hypothetical protein